MCIIEPAIPAVVTSGAILQIFKSATMKKTALLATALLWMLQATAQEPVKDKAYYLDKSKNQKTAGWVLLGAGTAMMIGGGIAFSNSSIFDESWGAGATVMTIGVPVALTSIPFFISAAKNKGRAEAMATLHLSPVPVGTVVKCVPQVGVRVSF